MNVKEYIQKHNIKERTLKQRTRNLYSVKHLGKAAGREGRAD